RRVAGRWGRGRPALRGGRAAAAALGGLSRLGRARGALGRPARARARPRALDARAHARRRLLRRRAVARHALDAMTVLAVSQHVPLAPLTTLGVGGGARWSVDATDETTVREACGWARQRGVPLRVLGGGSNLVVADAGVDALVVRIALRGLTHRERGDAAELTAAAGEPWDGVV